LLDIFISYAREDASIAKEFFDFFEQHGYMPWMDKENLLPGEDWEREIERAVRASDVCIFLLSENSVSKRGVFQREMRIALEKARDLLADDISILPIKVGECQMPDAISKFQWIDYDNPNRNSLLVKAAGKAAEQRGYLKKKQTQLS